MSTSRPFLLLIKRFLIHFLLLNSLFKLPVIKGLDFAPTFENEIQGIDEWIYSSVLTASADSNVSKECLQHIDEYLTALQRGVPWAVNSKLCWP
jgi:hypothetical protein